MMMMLDDIMHSLGMYQTNVDKVGRYAVSRNLIIINRLSCYQSDGN